MASFYDLQFSSWMGENSYWRMNAVHNFPNGYGVSVVFGPGSYGADEGKFELAVLKNGFLCYDSGITDDVIGYLEVDQVSDVMNKVEQLEPTDETKEQTRAATEKRRAELSDSLKKLSRSLK